jgi:hypothetical protein
MATSIGNWFENQPEVSDRIQGLDSDGDLTGNVTGVLFQSPHSAYSADGAIATTDGIAELDATSATTQMTLAAGTSGQRMTIICVNATEVCDVDADFGGAIVTATFSAAGETLDLLSDGASWYVTGNNGVALS